MLISQLLLAVGLTHSRAQGQVQRLLQVWSREDIFTDEVHSIVGAMVSGPGSAAAQPGPAKVDSGLGPSPGLLSPESASAVQSLAEKDAVQHPGRTATSSHGASTSTTHELPLPVQASIDQRCGHASASWEPMQAGHAFRPYDRIDPCLPACKPAGRVMSCTRLSTKSVALARRRAVLGGKPHEFWCWESQPDCCAQASIALWVLHQQQAHLANSAGGGNVRSFQGC